ncbi:MAG: hypothetical protein HY664_06170 [Chloroflexi bacterium]|nr:hypothetical protein [Chloroflexota bacterium]
MPLENRKLEVGTRLTPLERARLMARLCREENEAEMARIRDSVPWEHTKAYNRAVHVLARLVNPGALLVELVLKSAECDMLLLNNLLSLRYEQQSRRYALHEFWQLLGYPITESEYRALIETERGQLELLDDFARYITDTFSVDDAGEVCPPVATWLGEVPEDTGDDEALRQVRAIIDGAVEGGELPQPKSMRKPALPWGTLSNWLHRKDATACEPYPPDYYVPALEFLGALMARWDVRPDSEAAAVNARRDEIVNVLAYVAGLSLERGLDPRPHKSEAQRRRALKKMEPMNPWLPYNQTVEAMQALGRRHGHLRNHLQVLNEVLEAIRREDFGGEDPLLPVVRSLLAQAQKELEDFAEWWQLAGERFGMAASGDKWPAIHDFQGEDREELHAKYMALFQRDD